MDALEQEPLQHMTLTVATSTAVTERNLHEIADSIWESVEQGKQSRLQAIEANFAIGRDLMDARARFPSDNDFGEWCAGQSFPFGQSWAWTLRAAAEREPEVRKLVITQVMTGAEPNIKKAVAEVRRPRFAAVPSPIPYTTAREVDLQHHAAGLVDHVEALDRLRADLSPVDGASALHTRSRAAFARRLRAVGTYLGSIALTIEEEQA